MDHHARARRADDFDPRPDDLTFLGVWPAVLWTVPGLGLMGPLIYYAMRHNEGDASVNARFAILLSIVVVLWMVGAVALWMTGNRTAWVTALIVPICWSIHIIFSGQRDLRIVFGVLVALRCADAGLPAVGRVERIPDLDCSRGQRVCDSDGCEHRNVGKVFERRPSPSFSGPTPRPRPPRSASSLQSRARATAISRSISTR